MYFHLSLTSKVYSDLCPYAMAHTSAHKHTMQKRKRKPATKSPGVSRNSHIFTKKVTYLLMKVKTNKFSKKK